ILVLVDAMLHS
nr:protein DW53 [rat, liver, golgi-enriched membranes, Peptide Partial, 11 aa] [Rattus norvegicus]